MPNKIVWKVSAKPTGPHASFRHRGWPMGYSDKNLTRPVANITCGESYYPPYAKVGRHTRLGLQFAVKTTKEKWELRTLDQTFQTLDLAKKAAQEFYDNNPELFA